MFGINLNPVNLVATAAFGPLGGIASQLVSQLASNIGQQIIQGLGDNLGLPQHTIDMAQGAFAGSMGDIGGVQSNMNEVIQSLGDLFGATPAQIGEAQGSLEDILKDVVRDTYENREGGNSRSEKGGWLMAMATVLGEELNARADELTNMADDIADGEAGDSAMFSAKSQEFSMMMNATNTAIKAVGEAMANIARKQ